MRKHFVLSGIIVFLIGFQGWSQEENVSKKFSYRSFSISPIGIYAGSNSGVAISGDVSFDYGKNIFGLGLGAGTEGNFVGSSDDFTEVNLLYGRNFQLSDKIFTDVYLGAGYFHFHTYDVIPDTGRKGDISERTIGFPIGAKLQFMFGPRFSMGVKLGANINSVESIGTLGMVLQWNSKRK